MGSNDQTVGGIKLDCRKREVNIAKKRNLNIANNLWPSSALIRSFNTAGETYVARIGTWRMVLSIASNELRTFCDLNGVVDSPIRWYVTERPLK